MLRLYELLLATSNRQTYVHHVSGSTAGDGCAIEATVRDRQRRADAPPACRHVAASTMFRGCEVAVSVEPDTRAASGSASAVAHQPPSARVSDPAEHDRDSPMRTPRGMLRGLAHLGDGHELHSPC